MAILDNFEVTVSSGGKTVQEYQPSADDDAALAAYASSTASSTIVKYIEAIPGAPFQIDYVVKGHISFGKGNYLLLKTYVDGQPIESPVITKERCHKSKSRHFSMSSRGAETGIGSERKIYPFRWKELSTTDQKPDGTVAEMKKKYGQIGTIKVELIRYNGSPGGSRHSQPPATLSDPIPEKVLKGRAVDMGFVLGQAEAVGASTHWHGEMVDKAPILVFNFLYRSKNALQVLGLIPRSPSPVPLEERDPDTLSIEEALELVRRQRAELEVARVKIKKEKAEEHLRQLASLKRDAPDEEDEEVSVVATTNKKTRTDVEAVELSD